jgi:hypothetical protein
MSWELLENIEIGDIVYYIPYRYVGIHHYKVLDHDNIAIGIFNGFTKCKYHETAIGDNVCRKCKGHMIIDDNEPMCIGYSGKCKIINVKKFDLIDKDEFMV